MKGNKETNNREKKDIGIHFKIEYKIYMLYCICKEQLYIFFNVTTVFKEFLNCFIMGILSGVKI